MVNKHRAVFEGLLGVINYTEMDNAEPIIHEPSDQMEAYKLFNKKYVQLFSNHNYIIASGCFANKEQVKDKYDSLQDCPELQAHFIAAKINPELGDYLHKTFLKSSFKGDFQPNYYIMYPMFYAE